MNKEDYISRVHGIIQDSAEFLEPDDVSRNLDEAVLLFSKDRPRKKVCEITGDGSTYEWTVSSIMSDWVENFSFIASKVEYPADAYQVPDYVDENYYIFYRKLVVTAATLYFKTTGFTAASGKKIRFEYAIPHTLIDSSNSIDDGDSSAVVNLAAALCFWALAAKFAQSSDPTISADSVDYQRKSDQYKDMAIARADTYKTLMGIGTESKATASAGVAIIDLDLKLPGTLGDYLTHPSAWR